MSSKRRRIPFGWWPANWGLEGKRRALAEAEYHLEGEELEQRLLELQHDDHDSMEFLLAKARLDLKHGKIKEHELRRVEATAKGESFVEVLHCELKSSGSGATLSFELDWNQAFVDELIREGWTGITDDEVVNRWFEDTCRYMFVQDELDEIEHPVTSSNRTRRDQLDDDRAEYS